MVSKAWVGTTVLLAAAVACQPAVEPAAESGEAASASSTDEYAVIYETMESMAAAWNAADLEASLAFFAEDFTQMPPGENARVGLDVIAARWREILEENTDLWEPTITELQIVGDLAFARVSATGTRTPKDGGEPTVTESVGLSIFRRQADGSWLMILEYWLPQERTAESAEAAQAIQATSTDETAILYEMMERMAETFNAGDIDGSLGFFTEDYAQMPPDADGRVGLDVIAGIWREFFAENEASWEPWVAEVQIVGDLAFVRGSATETATPKAGGETTVSDSDSLWVFGSQADGTWKMIFEYWVPREQAEVE